MNYKFVVTPELTTFLEEGKRYQFGLDTSGSESTEDLRIKVDLIKTLVVNKKLIGSTIFCFDWVAYPSIAVEDFGNSHMQGGGGSNMIPAFEQFDKTQYDGLILFTDGYTDFPQEKVDFPVLICFDEAYGQELFESYYEMRKIPNPNPHFNLTFIGERIENKDPLFKVGIVDMGSKTLIDAIINYRDESK